MAAMYKHASPPAGMPLHSPYTHTFLCLHTVPLHSCPSPCTHTLSLPTMSDCSFYSRLSHHYVCPALLLPELWHQCPERQLHGMPCFNPWHHEIIWGSWFLPGERDTLQFVSSWGAAEQREPHTPSPGALPAVSAPRTSLSPGCLLTC